jgi:hypothetical protein
MQQNVCIMMWNDLRNMQFTEQSISGKDWSSIYVQHCSDALVLGLRKPQAW